MNIYKYLEESFGVGVRPYMDPKFIARNLRDLLEIVTNSEISSMFKSNGFGMSKDFLIENEDEAKKTLGEDLFNQIKKANRPKDYVDIASNFDDVGKEKLSLFLVNQQATMYNTYVSQFSGDAANHLDPAKREEALKKLHELDKSYEEMQRDVKKKQSGYDNKMSADQARIKKEEEEKKKVKEEKELKQLNIKIEREKDEKAKADLEEKRKELEITKKKDEEKGKSEEKNRQKGDEYKKELQPKNDEVSKGTDDKNVTTTGNDKVFGYILIFVGGVLIILLIAFLYNKMNKNSIDNVKNVSNDKSFLGKLFKMAISGLSGVLLAVIAGIAIWQGMKMISNKDEK